MINPYLTIDRKYFSGTMNGQFVVTMQDLIDIPKLKQYFDISYFKDGNINFDTFDISKKIEIGKIIFEYYDIIFWIGVKKYINFEQFYINSNTENFQNAISQLDPKYFYIPKNRNGGEAERSNTIYELDKLPIETLFLFIKIYFYSKFSTENQHTKFMENTDVLTDVNLNKNQYTKIPQTINFIASLFNNWIKTSYKTIPFTPDYGNPLKELVQEKNNLVKSSLIKTTIMDFFEELQQLYTVLLKIDDIVIHSIGDYSLEIKIFLTIDNKKATFKIVN